MRLKLPLVSKNEGSMIFVLVNTVAILALLGIFFYTRVLYKRPPITENGERLRIQEEALRRSKIPEVKGMVPFEPLKVNISSARQDPAGDYTLKHIVGVNFSIEVRDVNQVSKIEQIKPIFLDQIISLLGKKTFEELTTVQGRYLLRSEMIEIANKILAEPLVTNLFFLEFVVQ